MNRVVTKSNEISLVATQHGEHPEVLLLHAGGERRHVWRPVQERLARSGINSIAYDQRGHGDSEGSIADGIEACQRRFKSAPPRRLKRDPPRV
ncbi:MAG: alpha/beta fold hydrolase [Pseudomonadota bacterium]